MSLTHWLHGLRSSASRSLNFRHAPPAARRKKPSQVAGIEFLEERTLLTTLDLSQAGVAETTLLGSKFFSGLGRPINYAGDINGDGFDDVIVPSRIDEGFRGVSYVIFGGNDLPATIDTLDDLGNLGVKVIGIDTNDLSSNSISSAGDVNGDGFDDLLIGAYYAAAAVNGKPNAGETYIVFGGPALPSTIELSQLGANGVTIFGAEAQDRSGWSVSTAGDVNGDGYDDVVIGAPQAAGPGAATTQTGEAYIVFGAPVLNQTLDLANLGNAGVTILGIDAGDLVGRSVNNAGDVNGDGFDDVILGAEYADGQGNTEVNAGESYIVFGAANLPATISLSNLGAGGVTIFGIDAGDLSGGATSRTGDVNGDGFDDIIIGARYGRPGGSSVFAPGQAYVVFGGSALPAVVDLETLGNAGITIEGIDNKDRLGRSVSEAGDFNGDGFDDFMIGSQGYGIANGKQYVGETYIIFGGPALPASLEMATLSNSAGLTIVGVDDNDHAAYASVAGDVNGDGFDDVVIGAVGASGLRQFAGEAYIVLGGNFTSSVTHPGDTDPNTLTGNAAANVMNGAGGDDTLIGNGGADALLGGQGDDVLAVSDLTFIRVDGGNGTDTLRLDGSGLGLDLTAIADQRIANIEVIDIRGNGQNTATVDLAEVLRLTRNSNPSHTVNTLRFRRNADDLVNIGPGWLDAPVQIVDGVVYEAFTQGAATVLIETSRPSVTLDVSGSALIENGGVATVTATLSEVATFDITVTLDFSGTAEANIDYLRSGSQIVIPTGSLSGSITLTAQQDAEFDPGETIVVEIDDAGGALELQPQQVTKEIVDDDHVPVFTSTSTPSVSENQTNVLSVVSTDDDLPPQTIAYSITGGIDQGKFSITFGGTLTFASPPDFENPTDFDQDNIYEVQVTANDGHGGVTSQDLLVTVTNVNDGTPFVTLSVSAGALVEAGGTATVTATLSAPTNVDVTINLGFSGTADFPADYARSATQIVIPAGSTTGSITLTAQQDTDFEVDQAITVEIASVTNGIENGNQQVSKPITDDDHAPAFTSTATPSVPENQTSVLTVVAIDDDVPAQLITFSITGGVDQGVFSITPGGVLTFATAPDFELPTDTGFDNVYNVQVTANDGHGGVTSQNIAVTVTDINENIALSVNGPAVTWTKKQSPVNVLPLATAVGGNLGGNTLVINVNAIGSRKKLLDQFGFPSTTNLGTSAGPQSGPAGLILEIQLAEGTTSEAVQTFLRGITFSTKGKGLKSPLRTLRVSLLQGSQEVAALTQTINVQKKA